MQIAWDLLERSGEITDPGDVSRFLLGNVDDMMRAGEHRQLMLANNAIEESRSPRTSSSRCCCSRCRVIG